MDVVPSTVSLLSLRASPPHVKAIGPQPRPATSEDLI